MNDYSYSITKCKIGNALPKATVCPQEHSDNVKWRQAYEQVCSDNRGIAPPLYQAVWQLLQQKLRLLVAVQIIVTYILQWNVHLFRINQSINQYVCLYSEYYSVCLCVFIYIYIYIYIYI